MSPQFGPWGTALSLQARDGTSLRGALALPPGPCRGHVILLQGRSEFLEKYAGTVGRLLARGLAVASLDWRGQGRSERASRGGLLGHVDDFARYDDDLAALLAHPAVQALAAPRLLVAHSMGCTVALSWMLAARGEAAAAAILSAPMLGLTLSAPLRHVAPGLARAAVLAGLGAWRIPGSGRVPYALGPAEGNVLTADTAAFEALGDYLRTNPDLALCGPSFGWLSAAFARMKALRGCAAPVPVLVVLGAEEALVDPAAVRALGAKAGARLVEIAGARHEPLLDTGPGREVLWQAIGGFLAERDL